MPEWMKELYIAILKLNVPTKQLMPYRRTNGQGWSFMTMQKGTMAYRKFYDVQDFIDLKRVGCDDERLQQLLSRKRVDRLLEWLHEG